MSFFRKRIRAPIPYDPARQEPAVRRSICTGEMTAGFLDRETGRFHELMLLDGQEELTAFCSRVGVKPDEVRTIY